VNVLNDSKETPLLKVMGEAGEEGEKEEREEGGRREGGGREEEGGRREGAILETFFKLNADVNILNDSKETLWLKVSREEGGEGGRKEGRWLEGEGRRGRREEAGRIIYFRNVARAQDSKFSNTLFRQSRIRVLGKS
jgi:hypothetical protein